MMKTKIITIMSASIILCFTASELTAVEDKIFISDGVIGVGDEYANVYIYDTPPDRTTVNMSGGSASNILTYDSSILNVNGGTSEVYARNESTVNIGNGVVYTLNSYDFSVVKIFGGQTYHVTAYDTGTVNVLDDATLDSLSAEGFAFINISGGVVDRVTVGQSGTANLFGGLVNDKLWAGDSGIINLYGYDLAKFATGGHYGFGFVNGQWADRTPFNIDLSGSETYSRIIMHEIPEPATFTLIIAGSLLFRAGIRKIGRIMV